MLAIRTCPPASMSTVLGFSQLPSGPAAIKKKANEMASYA